MSPMDQQNIFAELIEDWDPLHESNEDPSLLERV